MFAAYAARIDRDQPLNGLELGERPAPEARPGWTTVNVRAASLNHHDLWSLRGVGLAEDKLPMILGCDAAGIDEDGNEVVLHSVIGQTGHGVGPEGAPLHPHRALPGHLRRAGHRPQLERAAQAEGAHLRGGRLSADRLAHRVPDAVHQRRGTARRLGPRAGRGRRCRHRRDRPRQGRRPAGLRHQSRRGQAQAGRRAGCVEAFEPGARLPQRVDAVIETVGAATWSHSVKSLRPGGTLVISGATSGDRPSHAELTRIFFLELKVVGSTMGSKDELEDLLSFCATTGVRPVIDEVLPLDRAREGFERLAAGDQFGKIVLTAS